VAAATDSKFTSPPNDRVSVLHEKRGSGRRQALPKFIEALKQELLWGRPIRKLLHADGL